MASYTSYIILPELKVIITNFQGKIGLNDLIQLNVRFLNDETYDSSFDIIMDFRDSLAIAFGVDIREFMTFFSKSVRLKTRIRSGILIQSPNQKFLYGIYKPIASLFKMDVENFEMIDKCLEWMKYSEDEQIVIKSSLSGIKYNSIGMDLS